MYHQLICQLSYPENVIQRPIVKRPFELKPGFGNISRKIEEKDEK